MKLHRVSILNDNPDHRGSVICSITSGNMAFLDKGGKMHHFDKEQTGAILCLFDELHDRSVESISMVRWLALTKEAKRVFAPGAAT